MNIKIPNFTCSRGGLSRWVLCMTLMFGTPSVYAQGDALDEAAVYTTMADSSLLMDLDNAGNKLVAVGERGHILISDDGAESWRQAEVPVRVTLTASYFVNEQVGWAVGHDGVVLRTRDGGQRWQKVLDGYRANELMLAAARKQMAERELALAMASEDQQESLALVLEEAQYLLEDAESFLDEGASRPLLDVWFRDENEGYVVGAFGLFLHTLDGGESWAAWINHIDNPNSLHLNAIHQAGDDLYLAAEAGNLFRSGDGGASWEHLESPYEGSFFGLISDSQGRIIAYGLRGHAFRSDDSGNSWNAIKTDTDASLFAGALMADGTVVLAGAAGTTVVIHKDGSRVRRHQTQQRRTVSALVGNGDKDILMAGEAGVQTLTVDTKQLNWRS